MSRSQPDHVIMDGKDFHCLHCDERHSPSWPMPLDVFVDKGRGFMVMHRNCVKKPEPSRQVDLPNADAIMGQGVIDGSTDEPAPEIDPPGTDLFAKMYPMAADHATLRNDLHRVLSPEHYAKLPHGTVEAWPPRSAQFDEVANWARIGKCHLDHQARAQRGEASIPGLYIRSWMSMPHCLEAIVGKPKKQKGARPLTSPKKGKKP